MQTIGERLEEARKKKGISIREAAEATKVRGDYLQKFESNDFDIGLTEIYTRGFLRSYANFLKLPADRILNDYAALGRSAGRPRQPSREVYGRMDISVATAADATDRAAPPPEAAAEPAAARGQGATRQPRGGTNLPSGPDPAVVFKYLKWGGIAVIVLIAGLVLGALFDSGPSSPSPSSGAPGTPSAAARPGERTITLTALDVVRVEVLVKNDDGSEGEAVLPSVTLMRNEQRVIPWRSALYISASAGENLRAIIDGKSASMPFTGFGRGQLPPPTP